MIPINELRIGNAVTHDDYSSGIFTVKTIEIRDGVYVVDTIGGKNGSWINPIDLINPIPLTEELLLKAGFRKAKCSGGGSDYWQGQLVNLTEDLRLSTSNREYDSQDVDGSKQFEFAHELQNIAMDLTGQELTLNL